MLSCSATQIETWLHIVQPEYFLPCLCLEWNEAIDHVSESFVRRSSLQITHAKEGSGLWHSPETDRYIFQQRPGMNYSWPSEITSAVHSTVFLSLSLFHFIPFLLLRGLFTIYL